MPRYKMTRLDASNTVANSLREFGYPDVTGAMVKEVLDAWLAGKRDDQLPHDIVGMLAGRQFDEIEDVKPGSLAAMAE